MNNDYVFLFTIGPVQSFIRQARKTVDLFGGSRLLSQLVRETIQEAVAFDPKKITAVFPHNPKKKSAVSLPNRFCLSLKDMEDADVQDLGASLEKNLRARWEALAVSIPGSLEQREEDDPPGKAFHEKLLAQSQAFLEVYWVAVPITDRYIDAYNQAQRELEEIKHTRSFGSYTVPEAGRLCSVCGERDALAFGAQYVRIPHDARWNEKQGFVTRFRSKAFSSGEGLCGVCLCKRYHESPQSFPSTSAIASQTYVRELEAIAEEYAPLRKPLDAAKNQVGLDAHLWYPENRTLRYLSKQGMPLKKAEEKHRKLTEVFRALQSARESWAGKKPRLRSYYGLLSFDGDKMGRVWGNEAMDADKQRELAECLANFSQQASKYLEKGRGRTVYAGGDDFLGFVTVDDALKVLRRLRKLYRKTVAKTMAKSLGLPEERFTFSAGLVFAHYKMPLGMAIDACKEAEHYAKHYCKRNALCITTLKHAGEEQRTAFKWTTSADAPHGNDGLKGFRKLVKALGSGGYSNTFILRTKDYSQRLFGVDNIEPENYENYVSLQDALVAMVEYQVQRAKARKDASPARLSDTVIALFNATTLPDHYSLDGQIQNFLSSLEIADSLQRIRTCT